MLRMVNIESCKDNIDELPMSFFPAFIVKNFIRLFLNPDLFQDFGQVKVSTLKEQFQSSEKFYFYMALYFSFNLLLWESGGIRNCHFFI